MDRFGRLPQVTIAAVHGYALGGGCMLAAAQDLRLAAASARFGLPEITLGFNPSYGIARLLDLLGGAHARDLLLTGRSIDAAEAERMGLVTRVVPDGALEAEAAALAADDRRAIRGAGWPRRRRSWPTSARGAAATPPAPTRPRFAAIPTRGPGSPPSWPARKRSSRAARAAVGRACQSPARSRTARAERTRAGARSAM